MARRARGGESSPDGASRVSESSVAVRAGGDDGVLVQCGEDFLGQALGRWAIGGLELSTMPWWARATERAAGR